MATGITRYDAVMYAGGSFPPIRLGIDKRLNEFLDYARVRGLKPEDYGASLEEIRDLRRQQFVDIVIARFRGGKTDYENLVEAQYVLRTVTEQNLDWNELPFTEAEVREEIGRARLGMAAYYARTALNEGNMDSAKSLALFFEDGELPIEGFEVDGELVTYATVLRVFEKNFYGYTPEPQTS